MTGRPLRVLRGGKAPAPPARPLVKMRVGRSYRSVEGELWHCYRIDVSGEAVTAFAVRVADHFVGAFDRFGRQRPGKQPGSAEWFVSCGFTRELVAEESS